MEPDTPEVLTRDSLATRLREAVEGFTLIEIAVVLGLIAALASLAVPALRRAVPPQSPRPDAAMQSAFTLVDEAVDALQPAEVAFNAPRTMQFGESTRITALLSASLSPENLTREVRRRAAENDRVTALGVDIAPQMELRLTSDGFRIEPLTPARQFVGNSGAVEWAWTINPVAGGVQRLYLSVDAILTVAGNQASRSIRVLEQPIEVEVTFGQQAVAFVSGNWQFVVGTLLIPFAVWRWKQRHA